jgi:hypothetical protein
MKYRHKPVPKGSHKRAAQAAAKVLRATDNHAVGYGDSGLLHLIADELGWPHECWFTEKRVLDAIDRYHEGVLVKRYFRARRGLGRVFYLPEHVPT